MKYKKYLRPMIELILVFGIIPIGLTYLQNDTANGLLMALLVIGNPLALLEINKRHSALRKDFIVIILSLVAILLQMRFFLFSFIVEYIIFYMTMALLGMRLGSIKRKIRNASAKSNDFTE